MANYRTSRVLPIILVVVIIIIAIAALVSLARVVFFSGQKSTSTVSIDTSRTALLDTSVTHSVRMVVRGPIVADEKFHSYQIDISSSNRSLKTFSGYTDTVVDEISLGNNVASYEEFVHALDKANLSKGKELEGDKNDIRGVCATGTLTQFMILNDNDPVKELWTSTCGGSKGSLNGSVAQLNSLFVSQIPNASALISRSR